MEGQLYTDCGGCQATCGVPDPVCDRGCHAGCFCPIEAPILIGYGDDAYCGTIDQCTSTGKFDHGDQSFFIKEHSTGMKVFASWLIKEPSPETGLKAYKSNKQITHFFL